MKRGILGNAVAGACLTVAVGAASASAPVGTLAQLQGRAVLYEGAHCVVGREGMALSEGNRLMVLKGGTATIKFTDGCRYTIDDNELLSIGSTSTCAADGAGSYKIGDSDSTVSQDAAAAGAGSEQPEVEPRVPADSADPNRGWVPAAAAGLVAVLGVAANTGGGGTTRRGISP